MKKKLISLTLLGLLVLVGCKQESPEANLSTEDQALVWKKDQPKAFGKFDYVDITRKEAEKLMAEKFKLELSDLYTDSIPVLEEALQTDENVREEPVYLIRATGKELLLRGTFAYKNKKDGNYYAYGVIEMNYEFDETKKQARLSTQNITITNYPENQTVYVNEPLKVVEKFAELAKVKNVEEKLATFTKEFEKPAAELKDQKIVIENSLKQAEKDQTVGRNVGIDYAGNGTLTIIRVFVKDSTVKM